MYVFIFIINFDCTVLPFEILCLGSLYNAAYPETYYGYHIFRVRSSFFSDPLPDHTFSCLYNSKHFLAFVFKVFQISPPNLVLRLLKQMQVTKYVYISHPLIHTNVFLISLSSLWQNITCDKQLKGRNICLVHLLVFSEIPRYSYLDCPSWFLYWSKSSNKGYVGLLLSPQRQWPERVMRPDKHG